MRRMLLFLSLAILVLAGCSNRANPVSSLILDESVFYPIDKPPSIQIVTDDEIKVISTVDDYPSSPVISADKTRMVYISPYEFEMLGEAWLYEAGTEAPRKVFDASILGEDQSVQEVQWVDNRRIVIITGYRYGTIALRQNLYVLDTSSGQSKSVLQVEGNRDIRDLDIGDTVVDIKIVTYNDDLTGEDSVEAHVIKINELPY